MCGSAANHEPSHPPVAADQRVPCHGRGPRRMDGVGERSASLRRGRRAAHRRAGRRVPARIRGGGRPHRRAGGTDGGQRRAGPAGGRSRAVGWRLWPVCPRSGGAGRAVRRGVSRSRRRRRHPDLVGGMAGAFRLSPSVDDGHDGSRAIGVSPCDRAAARRRARAVRGAHGRCRRPIAGRHRRAASRSGISQDAAASARHARVPLPPCRARAGEAAAD